MKKKIIAIVIISMFLLTSLATFPITAMNGDEDVIDPEWVTTWHEQNLPQDETYYQGRCVAIDEKNDYIYIAGFSSGERPEQIAFLVQYDLNGNYITHKIWHFDVRTSPMGIAMCVDNGFVYVAHPSPQADTLVIEKYDYKLSSPLWSTQVNSDGGELRGSVPKESIVYGEYLYLSGCGYCSYGQSGFLLKCDLCNGNIKWIKTRDHPSEACCFSHLVADDDYIYVDGWIASNLIYGGLITSKYHIDGTLENEAIWDAGGDGCGSFSAAIRCDGGYLNVFANHYDISLMHCIVILLKYDLELNQKGEPRLLLDKGDWNQAEDAIIYNNHIFVVGSTGMDIGMGFTSIAFLSKYDLDGNMVWDSCKVWASNERSPYSGARAISTYDKNVYITGWDSPPIPKLIEAFLLKCNLDGSHDLTANAGGPYKGKNNTSMHFYGSASDGAPSYTYSWDFDDSDGIQEDSTEQNPIHTYASVATYTATLTVTDSNGDTASDTAEVTITKGKSNNLAVNLLERILERFPILKPIIKPIIEQITLEDVNKDAALNPVDPVNPAEPIIVPEEPEMPVAPTELIQPEVPVIPEEPIEPIVYPIELNEPIIPEPAEPIVNPEIPDEPVYPEEPEPIAPTKPENTDTTKSNILLVTPEETDPREPLVVPEKPEIPVSPTEPTSSTSSDISSTRSISTLLGLSR